MTFPPAWANRLPSWLVEQGGAVCALLLGVVATWSLRPFWVGLFATGFSVAYEFWLDGNAGKPEHRPLVDMGQRQVGILVGCLALALLR